MLVYTSNVANAINRYREYFGVRIRYPELRAFASEKEFLSAINTAIKEKTPTFGGEYHKPGKAKPYVKPPAVTAEDVDRRLGITPEIMPKKRKRRTTAEPAAGETSEEAAVKKAEPTLKAKPAGRRKRSTRTAKPAKTADAPADTAEKKAAAKPKRTRIVKASKPTAEEVAPAKPKRMRTAKETKPKTEEAVPKEAEPKRKRSVRSKVLASPPADNGKDTASAKAPASSSAKKRRAKASPAGASAVGSRKNKYINKEEEPVES